MFISKYLKSYYKSIIWALVILALSLFKIEINKEFNSLNLPIDKFAHIFLYCCFCFLVFLETKFKEKKDINKKSRIIIILLLVNFYGITMEFLQYSLTTYRSAEILDFLSNLIGSLLGLFLFFKLETNLNRRFKIK